MSKVENSECNTNDNPDPAVVGSGSGEVVKRLAVVGVAGLMLGRLDIQADVAEVCGPDDEAVSRTVGEDWRGNQKRHERMWRQQVTSASRRFQRRC